MAISLFCPNCKNHCNLKSSNCPKCNYKVPPEGRRYRVRVMANGKSHNAYTNSLTKAREMENEWIYLYRYGHKLPEEPLVNEDITLDEAWHLYFDSYQVQGKSIDRTFNLYTRHLKFKFGNIPLRNIRVRDVEIFQSKMLRSNSTRGKKFAPKSVRMMIGLLGRIINYAIRMDYFEGANPVKKVTLIKDNTRLIRYLEPEEMHRLQSTLVNWPDREVANLVGLILNTGLRRGEVLKLEWNDIDFRNGNLHLREPKGGRDQFIPLSPDALDCLKSQKPYRKRTTNLVFSSSNGKKRTNSDKFWQKIRKAAELPDYFRLHDLRHNFASWLASSGEVDLMTLQALLTHKDPRTTQRYAHLFPNSLRRGANVFSRITQNLGVPDDKRIVSMDERRNA